MCVPKNTNFVVYFQNLCYHKCCKIIDNSPNAAFFAAAIHATNYKRLCYNIN